MTTTARMGEDETMSEAKPDAAFVAGRRSGKLAHGLRAAIDTLPDGPAKDALLAELYPADERGGDGTPAD
jgi:hypothetical protein